MRVPSLLIWVRNGINQLPSSRVTTCLQNPLSSMYGNVPAIRTSVHGPRRSFLNYVCAVPFVSLLTRFSSSERVPLAHSHNPVYFLTRSVHLIAKGAPWNPSRTF